MKFLIIPPPLAQGRITECHLGQCSLWNYIYEIHLSPSFFHSFRLSLSVPLSLPPSSNWRCNKGVWGQWFFKVRPASVSHFKRSPPDTRVNQPSSTCRSSLTFFASFTKTTALKPSFVPQIT